MKLPRRLAFYPLLLALHPMVFLYDHNRGVATVSELVVPALLSLAFTLVLWAIVSALTRSSRKGAVLASLVVTLFFSFGRFVELVGEPGARVGRLVVAPEALVGVLCLLAIALVASSLARSRSDLARVTVFLNLAAVCAIAIPLLGSALYGLRTVAHRMPPRADATGAAPAPAPDRGGPDIYYLILDGYARADVLRDLYGYDNRAFLDALRRRGFFVADRSCANYAQTRLSLASSLNLAYLDDLVPAGVPYDELKRRLKELIAHSAVRQLLRARGYTFVAFESGYGYTDIPDADLFRRRPGGTLTELQSVLLGTTPLPALQRVVARLRGPGTGDQKGGDSTLQYDAHRLRITYTFDHLPDAARMGRPVLVFAHLVVPHPPFVFDEAGRPLTPSRPFWFWDGNHFRALGGTEREYLDGYRRQLTFVNSRALAMVDGVLASSARPPVIILQADHGPGSRLDLDNARATDLRERMAILNAYLIPGCPPGLLTPDISPVNSFRVVLDALFSAGYPPLANVSRFSTWREPLRFVAYDDTSGSKEKL